MLKKIDLVMKQLEELSKSKPFKIISHFDTDGIASAAIIARAFQRWKKRFSLEIIKNLEEPFIKSLPEDHVLIFLDLASGSLDYLKEKKTEIIILDHHEITEKIPENITMVNPHLDKFDPVSSAAICYLLAKRLSPSNHDLAHLAIIGMVGDTLEKNLNKTYDEILRDSGTIVKRGLLIYPSTRPLDKALEYSSNPLIPGVTGSYRGAVELLRDAKIPREGGRYKSLHELTDEEMGNLITSILLRGVNEKAVHDMLGNIYLVKSFNKLEDARECSALINACSRMGYPYIALGFSLGNKSWMERAEKIYYEYKQHLISALRYAEETEKIIGKNYAIINAKDKIRDTIIGTVASIISRSPIYDEGTIIIALAYYNDNQIKVSARISGKRGRNVREVLHQAVAGIGGEVGGHPEAAGCLISKEKEEPFIEELKKILDLEMIKV